MATKANKRQPKRKPLPVCTKKDLRKKKSKRRPCRVPAKSQPKKQTASPTGPAAAPPATATSPDAFPTAYGPSAPILAPVTTPEPAPQPPRPADPVPAPAEPSIDTGAVPRYSGSFGAAEASRLLWRAGFGPAPGQLERVAAMGLDAAVDALLYPGSATLVGPAPTGSYLVGGELQPRDFYGHLHLAFLDRMVRSADSLTERMTLVLHDWFGVGGTKVESWGLMTDHLDLLRGGWRGSFRDLLKDVTKDAAMLVFLDGRLNVKTSPNENYARELMELYTLGADRGAYTETDVKEAARALTGWGTNWSPELSYHDVVWNGARWDYGNKTLFSGKPWQRAGAFISDDVVDAIVDHPLHASFVVTKLWSYFIPTAPDAETVRALEDVYRRSGERLLSVVAAILRHPDLYRGPSMVKPPAVLAAGLMRARGQGLTTQWWIPRLQAAGQFLGDPPSVAGWNDRAWLNSATYRARWIMSVGVAGAELAVSSAYAGLRETAAEAVDRALAYWQRPAVSSELLAALTQVASVPRSATEYSTDDAYLAARANTLRQMIAVSPDFQVC